MRNGKDFLSRNATGERWAQAAEKKKKKKSYREKWTDCLNLPESAFDLITLGHENYEKQWAKDAETTPRSNPPRCSLHPDRGKSKGTK